MKNCPTCSKHKPDSHFVKYNAVQTECRACRKLRSSRDARRAQRRDAWKRAQYILGAKTNEEKRAARLMGNAEHLILQMRLRSIKTMFLSITRVTRRRIKIMERNPNPNLRTEKALAVRRELLERYETAYQSQKVMVERGELPPHINNFL